MLASFAGMATAEVPAAVAGLYEIRQMEMGGGLELTPDGRFRYALEYGAASERGEGDWTLSGNSVLLTSNPKPKAKTSKPGTPEGDGDNPGEGDGER